MEWLAKLGSSQFLWCLKSEDMGFIMFSIHRFASPLMH
jgi:hypothetical protein